MDKNLLYEPLQEARQHYDEYFKKQQGKIPKQDEIRYQNQYDILTQIIDILGKTPQEK